MFCYFENNKLAIWAANQRGLFLGIKKKKKNLIILKWKEKLISLSQNVL